jgi:hypothetical protein
MTLLVSLIFRESIVNLFLGQFAMIELALLAAIWGYLVASGKATDRARLLGDVLVGVALAVLFTKPQAVGLAVLLVGLWAISRRRFAIPLAAVVSALLLFLLPLIAYPNSLVSWWGIAAGGQAASQMEVSASVWGLSYTLLNGVLPWVPVALALSIAGLVLLVPHWWWDFTDRSSPVPLSLPLTLCVNSVISPYMLQYEHLLLLLPAMVYLAAAGLPNERPDMAARRWRFSIYIWIAALPFLIVALQTVEQKEYVTVIQSATMLAICLVARLNWSSRVAPAHIGAPQPSHLQGA